MARIRYIKPKFFTDSAIGKLEPLARLMFAGMWTIADREGRLEDSPEEIGIQTIPYDIARGADPATLINLLAPHFIIRYSVNGSKYIQIRNFAKHQRVHNSESKSEIPAPDKTVTVSPTERRTCGGESEPGGGESEPSNALAAEKNVRKEERGKRNRDGEEGGGSVDILNDSDKVKTDAPPHALSASPFLPEGEAAGTTARRDNTDSIIKGQLPEADIMAVAGFYCEAKKLQFANDAAKATYLRSNGVFYPAKDILVMAGGDVALAVEAIGDHADYYAQQNKTKWDLGWVKKDFTDWDNARRNDVNRI